MPSESPTPTARKLKVFYFLHFMGVGIYYPFLAPYLRGLGFDGDAIGTAQMAGAIAAVPGALLWGRLADRLRAPTKALRWASRGALVAALLLVLARTPRQVTLAWLVYGLVTPSIVPLLDTVTVESIRTRLEASYARIRLWGSLGFIATAQGLGMLLAARGDRPGDRAMPFAYASAVLGFAVAANLAPPAPLPAGPRAHLGEARALVTDRRLAILLAAGAVHAATTASYQLIGVLARDEGLPATVTGGGMAFGVLAEVLALFAFPALERRFELATLLAAAFAATALRWLLVAKSHGTGLLVALQGFHGLTFGLYWAASIRMLEHIVPSRLRATGQTLFTAATFSVGGAIGYRVAGFAYDRLGGARPVYAWAALVELVPFVLAWMLRRRARGILGEGVR
jgi:PPP family 3-phenylpropionic acid transporter